MTAGRTTGHSHVRAGRHAGRVAVVTGGAQGVGRACAEQFAAEGAAVAVADIDLDRAEEAAASIRDAGAEALAVPVDVSDEVAVRDMFAAVVARFGRVDVLHNNAAALGPDVYGADVDIVDLDLRVWDRTMEVNLRGVLLGCKHAVPLMRAVGGGAIVNTTSIGGLRGGNDHAAYGSAKAAIINLTRYAASMYGPDGIRCNAVAPGLVLGEAARDALDERQLAQFAVERALPWAADPADVASVVCWLASDDARCVTGDTVVVDSGAMARRPRDILLDWDSSVRP